MIERGRSLTWKSWMVGIEGKGCKILSRLSLSAGSQLEVSSAHWNHHSCTVECFDLFSTVGSVSSVQSDRLSNIVRPGLAKPQWYHCQQSLNPHPTGAVQIHPAVHCSAIAMCVTLTARLKTDWHCTQGFSTSVQSGLGRVSVFASKSNFQISFPSGELVNYQSNICFNYL